MAGDKPTKCRGGASKRGIKASSRISKSKIKNKKDDINEPSTLQENIPDETVDIAMRSTQDQCENVLLESMQTVIESVGDVTTEKGEDMHDSDDEFDQEIPSVISNEHGEDLLKQLAKFPSIPSIMVPLCRLRINTRVRPLRQEKEELKSAFRNEGYVKEKGMFILSTTLSDGSFLAVDDELKEQWGSKWLQVNDDFEEELATNHELLELSNRMFFVWEGNHRTAAWMEVIGEEFWNDSSKHVRVMATFIEPDLKCEIQLVATLQRLNLLNEDAIVKTNLKDYLYNAKTICECGENTFIENLTPEEHRKLETYKKLESKHGKRPWYPLTRVILGRMVYAPLYKRDYKARMLELHTSLSPEELREKEKKLLREISQKYGRKMAKVLSVLNPTLGKRWFEVLWETNFDSKWSVVTIEKLSQIAISALSEDIKVNLLLLLGGDSNIRDTWGLPKGDKTFTSWIAKEVWMTQLVESSQTLLEGILSRPIGAPILITSGTSLAEYFEEIKVVHRAHLFEEIVKDMAVTQPDRTLQVDMDKASRRLVFRYLKFLQKVDSINILPPISKAWCTLDGKATMFSSYMLKENGITNWERKNCPWWLDMQKGNCPKEEKELMDKLRKGKMVEASSSSEEQNKAASMQHELVENISRPNPIVKPIGRPKKRRILETGPLEPLEHDIEGELDTSPIPLRKHTNTKIIMESTFLSLDSLIARSGDGLCEVLCCDYVSLGGMVRQGKADSPEFKKIRDFFKKNCMGQSHRNGQACSWSVNTIFIDLPTTYPSTTTGWNALTDDHILYSLGLSAALMDDSGWVVLFAPMTSLGLVERHSRVVGLSTIRRFVVLDGRVFDEVNILDTKVKTKTLILYLFGKNNCISRVFNENAHRMGNKMKLNIEDEVLVHHLPIQERTMNLATGVPWRGDVEKSPCFMLFLIEYLCPPGGSVLDLGCGTGAALRAARHSGRPSFSIDFDEALVRECLSPMVHEQEIRSIARDNILEVQDGEESIHFQIPVD